MFQLPMIHSIALLLAGCLFGIALVACFLWLKSRKSSSVDSSDSIGAILVDSETPELLLARYDSNGEIVFLSQGVHALLGIEPEEFIAGRQELRSFVDLADLQVLEAAEASRLEGNDQDLQYQYRIRRQDGRWHWMHERQEAIKDSQGTIVAYETLAIDFTDRIRFEKQQRRLRELQRLLTAVLEGLVEWEDSPKDLNRTLDLLVRYLRLSGASILAVNDERRSLSTIVNVSSASNARQPGLPITGPAAAWWIRRISGAVSLVIHRSHLSEIEPRMREAFAAELEGSVLAMPLIIDGDLKYVLVLQFPKDDRALEPEELSVVQAIVHAISRRLENAEIRREREEFSELRANIERSELIRKFVSGIIHDFNNMIFAISGKMTLLLRKTEDEVTQNGLSEIRNALGEAEAIFKRLQHAERLGLDDPDLIDPWVEMNQIVKTAQRLLPKRIRFESEISPLDSSVGNRMIHAVPQTLQQLVLNLIVNSRDAVDVHGRIRIYSSPSSDNQSFEVTVEDNGPGIPPEKREEFFKPNISTKSDGKGTGLGLSICRRVVSDAGGTLSLSDSALGGLKAKASFPLVQGAATKEEEPEVVTERLEGTVFLIEDNETIRDVLVRELQSTGAKVVSRSDALDAESVLEEHGDEIVLLVFDIDLPERTGIECLQEFRDAGSTIPCLLITGGTSDAPDIWLTELLRKPFRMPLFLATCKDMIENGNANKFVSKK